MNNCSSCGEALQTGARFCPSCGAKVVASGAGEDALIGRILREKYRVVDRIGAGSMGTVYEGEHIGLQKKVALKILRPELELNDELLQRFQREGIAAGKLSHPGAIQIFDFDRAEERIFFLAMEFVEGSNLKEFLRDEGPIPIEEAVEITRQILETLAVAHEQGIVHRDLKPENVMVTRGPGGELAVKVLDFGLSKLVHVPLGASLATVPGRVMGTPMYMSPEQGLGEEVDARTDLYSVGLILYELLAGETPFHGETLTELVTKQLTEPPPSLTDSWPDLRVPGPLDDVVAKALEKQKEDRFASAEEMLAELEAVDLDDPRPASRRALRRSTVRRRASVRGASVRGASRPTSGVRLAGIAALVLALGGGSWWVLGRGEAAAAVARVSMKPEEDRSAEEASYVRLLTEARADLRAGDADGALARVSSAHELACRDSEAYFVRGEVYAARGDLDAALADYREALGADPGYARAAAAVGWLELERGDLAAARKTFDEAVALDPACAAAVAGQGAVELRTGGRDAARPLLEHAVELDPEEPRASRVLGGLLLSAGELDGAIEAFVRAKRADPRSAETLYALGRAYLERGRNVDAERELRAAIALEPGSEDALTTLAALLVEEERFLETIELLEEPVDRHPAWGPTRVLLGSALEAEGRAAEAIAVLEEAVERIPGDPFVRTLLGILYQGEGRHEDAVAEFDAAIAINENLVLPHLDKGLCLFELEEYGAAAAELELALRLDPEEAQAHYALGILYMDYVVGDGDALAHLEEYVRLGGADERVDDWIERLGG